MAGSKRYRALQEKAAACEAHDLNAVLSAVKELATARFDEAVDVCVNLGVDPRKSDQVVRGSSVLPNGTGRSVRVAVFADDAEADAALAAGADRAGIEALTQDIKAGNIDFDLLIATPSTMPKIGPLGRLLGPKGLMPNPKVGTVTTDVADAVKKAKTGQVQYRTDKGGIIHCSVGKASFTVEQLAENIYYLMTDLVKAKPSSAKGIYLKKVTVSSTMGAGIVVDRSAFADL